MSPTESKIQIPFDLKKALKSGFFISGTSGSGKTNLAFNLAEILMENGVVVFAFDPSQAWMQNSSIPFYKTIDENTEKFWLKSDQSIIFDISLLYVKDQRSFVEKIAKSLFMQKVKNPKVRFWTVLIFEESQLYLQQSAMRSKAYMEMMRLITVGRNYKLRYGLITQFPSMIDKLCVKMTQQRYFGYSDEKNDLDYVNCFIPNEDFYIIIKDPVDKKEKKVPAMCTFQVGEFFYDVGAVTQRVKTPLFQAKSKPQPWEDEFPMEEEEEIVEKKGLWDAVKDVIFYQNR